MKAVIIGAGKEALHTIEKAREQGLTVIAMDGDPKAAGLKAADEAMTVDISDEKAAITAVERVKPDFLLTVPIGRYLTTTGAVNDALGLPGISREAAQNCTDKWRFHQLLNGQGLRNHKSVLLPSHPSVKAPENPFAGFGYPVILKPRYGSGSRGILIAENQDELRSLLSAGNLDDYLLEECVQGEEYGVDGAVIQGEFHLILLRKKENTPFPARQAVAYFNVLSREEFYAQVEEHLKQVVQILKLQECLVHGDIIRTPNGPFVIEISARPSGHNLHNLFTPLATGVDMAKEYICYRMGKAYHFEPVSHKRMMIHYFDMEGRVNGVPSEEEICRTVEDRNCILRKWHCNIRKGEMLKIISDGHSLMGRGYFILERRGESSNAEKELKQAAETIKTLFRTV